MLEVRAAVGKDKVDKSFNMELDPNDFPPAEPEVPKGLLDQKATKPDATVGKVPKVKYKTKKKLNIGKNVIIGVLLSALIVTNQMVAWQEIETAITLYISLSISVTVIITGWEWLLFRIKMGLL